MIFCSSAVRSRSAASERMTSSRIAEVAGDDHRRGRLSANPFESPFCAQAPSPLQGKWTALT